MTANTTEQERAQALAEKHGTTSYRNRADTKNPAFGFTLEQLAALIADVEQAARRAPAVPEGWRLVPDEVPDEMVDAAIEAYMPFGDMRFAIVAALAAAPQPPDAFQTNVAAPGQLPEPGAWLFIDRTWTEIKAMGLDHGGKPAYTEKQVRQLLAAAKEAPC